MNHNWCFSCVETWACVAIGIFAGAIAIAKSKNYSTLDFVLGVMTSALLSTLFCVAGRIFDIVKKNQELIYVGSAFSGYNAQWFFDIVMPKIRKKIIDFLGKDREVR